MADKETKTGEEVEVVTTAAKPEPVVVETAATEAAKKLADTTAAALAADKKLEKPKPTAEEIATEEAAKAAEDTPKEYDTDVWGDTGSDTGNAVLQMLSDGGMDVAEAKAMIYDKIKDGGKPSDIDKEALIEKIGKAKANLVMAGITSHVQTETAKVTVIVDSVHKAAGGTENWDTVVGWSKDNLTEADMAEYSEMINKGGVSATAAVKAMVGEYNANESTDALTAAREVTGDITPTNKEDKGLSSAEYGKQLVILNRRGMGTPEARAKLLAARRRGTKQGL